MCVCVCVCVCVFRERELNFVLFKKWDSMRRSEKLWVSIIQYRWGKWPEKKNIDSISTIIMRFSQGKRKESGTLEYRANREKDVKNSLRKLFDLIPQGKKK